jgi:predicted DNA-binding protein
LPYVQLDGTMTQFNISHNGQTVSYFINEAIWHHINFKNGFFIYFSNNSIVLNAIARQMPADMTIHEAAKSITSNNLLRNASHK